MAGFQQAANALTGAVGTVANRVGLYSELVGKNQQYRAQLEKQNMDLTKTNEDLEAKKIELEAANKIITSQKEQIAKSEAEKAAKIEHELELGRARNKRYRERQKAQEAAEDEKAKSEVGRLDRALSNNQAHMSKALALSLLYGDFASGSGGI